MNNFTEDMNDFKEYQIKKWIRNKGYKPTVKKAIVLFRKHGVVEYTQKISDTKWHYLLKTKSKEIIYNITHEFIIEGDQ